MEEFNETFSKFCHRRHRHNLLSNKRQHNDTVKSLEANSTETSSAQCELMMLMFVCVIQTDLSSGPHARDKRPK